MASNVLSYKEAKSRAVKGAALLDLIEPDWTGRVSLEALQMGDCSRCVLGQLFGTFEDGVEEIEDLEDLNKTGENGFDVYGEEYDPEDAKLSEANYDTLRRAWVDIIRERMLNRPDAVEA